MAKYVVPPKHDLSIVLIKCRKCKALYSPEKKFTRPYITSVFYEKCPICKYEDNTDDERIPLGIYNLIRWWRERTQEEELDITTIPPSGGSSMQND